MPDDVRTAQRGPVEPTTSAIGRHRPLAAGSVRLTDGLLADWQRRNAHSSLPLAPERLRAAGNLANLEAAATADADAFTGPVFMDSDIYKSLEAIGWQLGIAGSDQSGEFAAFLETASSLIEQAQQPDGYLNSWVQATSQEQYAHLSYSHELYCAGHLIQAAIALRRATGNDRLLDVARRFADHLVATFLDGGTALDGHPEVETALVELFRETGHAPYLALAKQFVDQRGRGLAGEHAGQGKRYFQDDMPVRERTTEVGHAVRAMYLEAGVVDVAVETGDTELLASSVARWDDVVAYKTALTGGHGSRHSDEGFGDRFELPPDRSYNETCAAIACIHWSWRLLLATGEAKYGELIERILYNGFGGSVSTDGTKFFYVNPLQRRSDHVEKDDPGCRHEWFSCACCPPNIMRMLASVQHYVATASASTLYIHQFTGCELDVATPTGRLGVRVTTDYPWSGHVRLEIVAAPTGEHTVAMRRPGWSRSTRITVGNNPVPAVADAEGYLRISRPWQVGDVLKLEVNVAPRITLPDRRIDALRGTAALERGPLVYCVEEVDLPAGTTLDDVVLLTERPVEESPRAEVAGIGPTVALRVAGVAVPSGPPSGLPYATADSMTAGRINASEIQFTAVPYFQWDNRGVNAMKLWLPTADRSDPARGLEDPLPDR